VVFQLGKCVYSGEFYGGSPLGHPPYEVGA
jgi:hypothetical protein